MQPFVSDTILACITLVISLKFSKCVDLTDGWMGVRSGCKEC